MSEADTLARVRAFLQAPDARPFFEALAEIVGFTRAHSALDGQQRTDPLALSAMKAEQDLALKIFGWGGWSLRATPPQRDARPSSERKTAITDGDGRDG